MKIKIKALILLLLSMTLDASTLYDEDSLDKERITKLKQVVTALVSADTDTLVYELSSEHQTISNKEAASIIEKITSFWGELTKLEEIDETSLETTLKKNDMHVLVHWGSLPTQYGKWMLFKSGNRENFYLRIGLLFGKDYNHTGQFVALEFPILQKTEPNELETNNKK